MQRRTPHPLAMGRGRIFEGRQPERDRSVGSVAAISFRSNLSAWPARSGPSLSRRASSKARAARRSPEDGLPLVRQGQDFRAPIGGTGAATQTPRRLQRGDRTADFRLLDMATSQIARAVIGRSVRCSP